LQSPVIFELGVTKRPLYKTIMRLKRCERARKSSHVKLTHASAGDSTYIILKQMYLKREG
jgi:hypothetical protein